MTLSVHHYRKRNGHSKRYPAEGKPPDLSPAAALSLIASLTARFPGSRAYAVALNPARTYDAAELLQMTVP